MRRLLTSAIMLVSVVAVAHAADDQIESKAGTWRTWVISSGREFSVAAPPIGTSARHRTDGTRSH